MKTTYLIFMFILVAGVQLYVPTKMILDQEEILTEGKAFKFKTQPIDPNDPFRGKYITLRYDIERSYKVSDKDIFGQDIYVLLKEDDNGFAAVDSLLPEAPESGEYIEVEKNPYTMKNEIGFDLYQNRFYMEETKAPEAEIAYNEVNRNGKEAYAVIYVLNGDAVLHDVIIEGKSITDYVE